MKIFLINNIETINEFMKDKEVYSISPLFDDKLVIQYHE
jgi:hypothetical protein